MVVIGRVLKTEQTLAELTGTERARRGSSIQFWRHDMPGRPQYPQQQRSVILCCTLSGAALGVSP